MDSILMDSIQDIQPTIWHKELLKMKTLLLKLGGITTTEELEKDGSYKLV